MRTEDEIWRIVRADGLIDRRRYPELSGTIDWLVRCGRLARVLPNVYAADPQDLATRLAALPVWDPDAVVLGEGAARLTFWPGIRVSTLAVASRRKTTWPGFDVQRRQVPPELVLERAGVRVTAPALTAVDLAISTGGGSIDTALRTRAATLTDLHRALELTGNRPGTRQRRRLLADSRAEPWSYAERQAHRLLRAGGITGWVANLRVVVRGAVYFLDIGFEEQQLALEIDGRTYHGPGEFDRDRWRQNDIVLAGWRVLRFSADTVIQREAVFLRQVQGALDAV